MRLRIIILIIFTLSFKLYALEEEFFVKKYDSAKAYNGTTIFSFNADWLNSRIIEVDMNGNIVWQYRIPNHLRKLKERSKGGMLMDVERLINGNTLFNISESGIYEIDKSGNIVWRHLDIESSHDVDRLDNGNTLYARGWVQRGESHVIEVDHNGEIVWEWDGLLEFNKEPYTEIQETGWMHVNAVERLNNGNTMISIRNFHMVIEVNQEGKIVRKQDFDCHSDWYGIERPGLPKGCRPHEPEINEEDNTMLVAISRPHKIYKIDLSTGKIIWNWKGRKSKRLRDTDRLSNGNVLIQDNNKLTEVTPEGETVWLLKVPGLHWKKANAGKALYKAQRIPYYNDNATISSKEIITKLDEVPYISSELTPLKELAVVNDIYIGSLAQQIHTARGHGIDYKHTGYISLLQKHFDLLIVDNGMYMRQIQKKPGRWNFSKFDEVVEYGKKHKMRMRGHPLVWGNDNAGNDWHPVPDWVRDGDFSREQTIEIMYKHIKSLMERHKGDIKEWVVVNEPIANSKYSNFKVKENVWTRKIGEDYVELAFKFAREIDPDAKLIINDWGVDYIGQYKQWSDRPESFYQYVKHLVDKETPIDAVGFEFHLTVGDEIYDSWKKDNPTVDSILKNLQRYNELGLDVHITEMDVKIKEPVSKEELEKQAEIYSTVLEACLQMRHCKSFSVWGHDDGHSWIPRHSPGFSAATLFDNDLKPKPAYHSVVKILEEFSNDKLHVE